MNQSSSFELSNGTLDLSLGEYEISESDINTSEEKSYVAPEITHPVKKKSQ